MAARLVAGPSASEPRGQRVAPQQQQPVGGSGAPGTDGEPVFFVFGGAEREQPSKDACCDSDGGGGGSHPESGIRTPDAGRCAEHDAVLDWFCVTEQRLLCAQCAGAGPCSGHAVTPLAARVTAVRNQLVDVCEKMQLQALRIERFIEQTLTGKERKLQIAASRAREQVLAQVSVAREALEEEEQRLLEEVQREEERVEECLLTQRAHWSQALRNLSQTRNCLVRTLTHAPDAQLVKSTQEIAERVEEAEGVGAPYDTHQLNLKADCSESKLLRGMWAAAILQGPHAYGSTSLKFDERTVSPLLKLSEDHCTLTFLHKKPYTPQPDNPARFDCWPNALGSLSTSSGTHSWVVDVGRSAAFKVGVCYATLQRKGSGNEARLGYNAKSWVLSHYDNDYSFCHAGKKEPLQVVSRPQRIGLLLDWPSQTVLFYVPESSAILYRFKHDFSAPLLPACAVTDRSITILH